MVFFVMVNVAIFGGGAWVLYRIFRPYIRGLKEANRNVIHGHPLPNRN